MSRVKKLKELLKEKNIDALLISNFYNIFYLTGFKTLSPEEREAWVLLTRKNTYLFTDGRYFKKNYQFSIPNLQLRLVEPNKGLLIHLGEIIESERVNSLAIEGENLRVFEYEQLKKFFFDLKILPVANLILRLREVKEEEEVEKIKKSCQIADKCLSETTKLIKVGMKEKEIAFKIEFYLKEKGFDLAFSPIVAVDKNSGLPHYQTGETVIGKGSVILIDFGVKYQDYCSDITRMIFINPSLEILNIYEKLLSIQEKTIQAIFSPSIRQGREIDQYCRNLIADSQLPDYSHSTGHGVGLEVHEYPKISQKSTDLLRPGQVFTIEPGVYFEEKWGMRIEDTVYINNKLKPEVLTRFSKQPLIFKF